MVVVQASGSMQMMSYFRVMLAMPLSPVKTSSWLPDEKGIVIAKSSISWYEFPAVSLMLTSNSNCKSRYVAVNIIQINKQRNKPI